MLIRAAVFAIIAALTAFAQSKPLKVVLVGDSTVNIGGGWGPGFCAMFTPDVTCVNKARNGRSSKSYYDEGAWKGALAEHGDYYLIQFGHNDMPGKGADRETDPETTYSANLRRYITQSREQGARPIIVTSLSRRNYKDGKLVTDLNASAARRVASEENVPLIDLYAYSVIVLTPLSQEQADEFNAPVHPDATSSGPDRTHLNEKGSRLFGRMIATELARVCPELRPSITAQAADTRP